MDDSGTFVIVGGGLAAAKAAEELFENGFERRLVIAGDEHHLPYERPPLSKGYLLGDEPLESAFVHPPEWYDERDVALRLGAPVTSVDLASRTVATGGERLRYDKLLLATGSSPRRLSALDASGAPVAYLRTIEDSDRIKAALQPWRRVVVVGGGWIGLEVAAAARNAGAEVVVVETLEKPLLRVLGPEVAQVFVTLHASHDVDLRTSTSVTSAEDRDGSAVVHLDDGTTVEADLVVVGIGVSPNTGLAEAAGLQVDDGIVVDAQLRTGHPDVFAAGDVANAYHPLLGRHLRVEHWDNAIGQGVTAARNMLGAGERYERLPYFFTDQYDLGMEYVGSVAPDGYDEVVIRGDEPERVFTAFWVREGRVVAGMHANDWDAMDPVRAVVTAGTVDLRRLRDASVPLQELVG